MFDMIQYIASNRPLDLICHQKLNKGFDDVTQCKHKSGAVKTVSKRVEMALNYEKKKSLVLVVQYSCSQTLHYLLISFDT